MNFSKLYECWIDFENVAELKYRWFHRMIVDCVEKNNDSLEKVILLKLPS